MVVPIFGDEKYNKSSPHRGSEVHDAGQQTLREVCFLGTKHEHWYNQKTQYGCRWKSAHGVSGSVDVDGLLRVRGTTATYQIKILDSRVEDTDSIQNRVVE